MTSLNVGWKSALALGGLSLALIACSSDDDQRGGGGPSGGGAGLSGGSDDIGGGGGSTDGTTQLAPGGAANIRDQGCASAASQAVNNRQPADIIWAVDNGGNIQSDIEYIRDNMNAFSQQIVDSGIDVHMVLITDALNPDVATMATPLGGPAGDWRSLCIDAPLGSGSCPDDSNLPTFLHVDYEVGTGHDIIPLAGNHPLNVFTAQYPQYQQAMRPDATKTFVAVSDVDAVGAPNDTADAFIASASALDPSFEGFKFSGVVAVSDTCPSTLFPPQVGHVYIDTAVKTGGVIGDICLQEFGPVFDDIAQGVIGASQLQCEWDIPPAPDGMTLDKNLVNVIFTSAGGEQTIGKVEDAMACTGVANGWHYDAAGTKVLVCPQSCDLIRGVTNGKVEVIFGCPSAGPE